MTYPKDQETENRESDEQNAVASGDYQTPVDEEKRHTGYGNNETNAKPSSIPESGNSDVFTEGGPNQGTEKR
ncbi:MAG: hypothetical protein KME57_28050 [Scytonema hyalinum WJT4-NPBG1]|jgi:hypothetical protein|nr:hypothetical protein [Scytonema hyalinum WJT4-NPBG1]